MNNIFYLPVAILMSSTCVLDSVFLLINVLLYKYIGPLKIEYYHKYACFCLVFLFFFRKDARSDTCHQTNWSTGQSCQQGIYLTTIFEILNLRFR